MSPLTVSPEGRGDGDGDALAAASARHLPRRPRRHDRVRVAYVAGRPADAGRLGTVVTAYSAPITPDGPTHLVDIDDGIGIGVLCTVEPHRDGPLWDEEWDRIAFVVRNDEQAGLREGISELCRVDPMHRVDVVECAVTAGQMGISGHDVERALLTAWSMSMRESISMESAMQTIGYVLARMGGPRPRLAP